MKRKKIKTVAICSLFVLNAIAIPILMSTLFPDNKGFTRNVIFVHPTEYSDGYYILVDEIHTPKSTSFQFHSRGVLQTGSSSATWTQDDVQMNCSFFGTPVDISPTTNYLYAYEKREEHEYIRVQLPKGANFLITVIHFTNLSLGYALHPDYLLENELITISFNSTDNFVLNPSSFDTHNQIWEYNSIQTDAKFFHYRETVDSDRNFILTSSITTLSMDETPVYNGDPQSIVYTNNTLHTGYFSGWGSSIEDSTPSNLTNFSSPGLYFTEEELPELRDRIAISGSQWEYWFSKLNNRSVLYTVFQGRIEENQDYINRSEQFLLELETYFNENLKNSQDIEQSTFLVDYILAYDMIYNNISSQSRETIESTLYELVEPLYIHHQQNTEYINNHLVVSSIATG